MDIIFSGEISSNEYSIQEVLTEIVNLNISGYSMLRLNNSVTNLSGRIYFHDGHTINQVNANQSDSDSYKILGQLLTTPNGNFAYIQIGMFDDYKPLTDMNIEIKSILEIWPNLPHDLRILCSHNNEPVASFKSQTTIEETQAPLPERKMPQSVFSQEDFSGSDNDILINPYQKLGQNPVNVKNVSNQKSTHLKLRSLKVNPVSSFINNNIGTVISSVIVGCLLMVYYYFNSQTISQTFDKINKQVLHNISLLTHGAVEDPLEKKGVDLAEINEKSAINKKPIKLKHKYHKRANGKHNAK